MSFMNPEARKAVKSFCDEMSASMARAEGERDFQKEAVKNIADEHELDKSLLKKMAKTYHRSSFATQKQDQEAFELAYEELFGVQA